MYRPLTLLVLLGAFTAQGRQAGTELLRPDQPEPPAHLLADINLLGGDYGDETAPIPNDSLTQALTGLHSKTHRAGLEFLVENAFSYNSIHHPAPDKPGTQLWYLLHAHANYRLLQAPRNRKTWLKLELSGSTALTGKTWRGGNMNDAIGLTGDTHTDIFGERIFFLPEIALLQTFNRGKSAIVAGVVNQTNYFDTNSYANSSFGQFCASPFVNNQVIPMADSNLGVIFQHQFHAQWYAMLGGNFTSCPQNASPLKHTDGKNFNILAELAWVHDSGAVKLTPFMARTNELPDGEERKNLNTVAGIALNVEQQLGSSPWKAFCRAGWSDSTRDNLCGAAVQWSGGLVCSQPLQHLGVCGEGEANQFGIALAVTRPDDGSMAEGRSRSKKEVVMECHYNISVTPWFLVQPSLLWISNPAGRDDTGNASVFRLQTILTF